MFTGIVRDTGIIESIREAQEGVSLRFSTGSLSGELKIGHSVSVDGVCLTVTAVGSNWAEVDATPETLRRSNLGKRRHGARLNLEPALRLTDFLGGHLVQGHVDATGIVQSIAEEGNSWVFRVSIPGEIRRHCVIKGSVTLNGISLTICGLGPHYLEVAIIPHTMEVTNMSDLVVGDTVNLEADVVSKYVESHVQRFLGDSRTSLASGQPGSPKS